MFLNFDFEMMFVGLFICYWWFAVLFFGVVVLEIVGWGEGLGWDIVGIPALWRTGIVCRQGCWCFACHRVVQSLLNDLMPGR
jgi:hypothetical protein